MTRHRVPRRTAVGLLATLALPACSPRVETENGGPTKTIDKSAQTDPAPVLKRTSGLPEDVEVLWFSGTLGSGAPGPSTYWVDARVTTTPQAVDELRALCPDGTASAPDVVDELARELDGEDYVDCPAAAAEIAVDGWETRVWLARTSPVMVITLVGQG